MGLHRTLTAIWCAILINAHQNCFCSNITAEFMTGSNKDLTIISFLFLTKSPQKIAKRSFFSQSVHFHQAVKFTLVIIQQVVCSLSSFLVSIIQSRYAWRQKVIQVLVKCWKDKILEENLDLHLETLSF